MATVFIRASAALSSKKPSPDTETFFKPARVSVQSAPSGVVQSGVVTSIAELLIVSDLLFNPQRLLKTSDSSPSPILTSRARPSCLAMFGLHHFRLPTARGLGGFLKHGLKHDNSRIATAIIISCNRIRLKNHLHKVITFQRDRRLLTVQSLFHGF